MGNKDNKKKKYSKNYTRRRRRVAKWRQQTSDNENETLTHEGENDEGISEEFEIIEIIEYAEDDNISQESSSEESGISISFSDECQTNSLSISDHNSGNSKAYVDSKMETVENMLFQDIEETNEMHLPSGNSHKCKKYSMFIEDLGPETDIFDDTPMVTRVDEPTVSKLMMSVEDSEPVILSTETVELQGPVDENHPTSISMQDVQFRSDDFDDSQIMTQLGDENHSVRHWSSKNMNQKEDGKNEGMQKLARYNKQKANEIEKTFNNEFVADINNNSRVIFNPLPFFTIFLGYLQYHWEHCPIREPFKNLQLFNVTPQGMRHLYSWTCTACNFIFKLWSDPKDTGTSLHEALVLGTLTAGVGYNVVREILAAMGILCMSDKTYRLTRQDLAEKIIVVSDENMKEAALEEANLAKQAGDVINGVPFITVIIDGAWSKRSYKGGRYDALSSVVVIIGKRTGKILYCGVKNKYCKQCEQVSSDTEPKAHECQRNYPRHEASSAMEAVSLVDGFKESVEKNGLIYRYIIGDGDSSVYSAIVNFNPYSEFNVRVEKFECVNHLYRRFSANLQEVSLGRVSQSVVPWGTVSQFRASVKESGAKIRKLIEASVQEWSSKDIADQEKINGLAAAIPEIVLHHFGDHSQCAENDEKCDRSQKNLIPSLQAIGWLLPIKHHTQRLVENADSLLKKLTTNAAEGAHSIGNKVLGGRRVNHTASNSYTLRQLCATIQYNSREGLSKLYGEAEEIPDAVIRMEKKKQGQAARTAQSRAQNHRIRHRGACGEDNNYGVNADQAELTQEERKIREERILANLKTNQQKREQIERQTTEQRKSPNWFIFRQNLLTASLFGGICRMLEKTSCIPMVRRVLYRDNFDNEHMQFGRDNEATALSEVAAKIEKIIQPCGLFIDELLPYLGATPDGLIDDDGIVEVKCLSSARDLTPEEAIKQKKSTHGRIIKGENMNPTHLYHYQVQGQLHITQRAYCIFALWTPLGIKTIRVERDDGFWEKQMEPKLTRFYMNCVLPEIANRKIYRKQLKNFKEPNYILEAQERYKEIRKRKEGTDMQRKRKRKGCPGQPQQFQVEEASSHPLEKRAKSGNSPSFISVENQYDPTEDQERIPERNEFREIPFQVITDTERLHTQEEFDRLVEQEISLISDVDVLRNIDDFHRKFESDTINMFLRILKSCTENMGVFWTSYFPYPQYTKPCQITRSVHIIGGNRSGHWSCLYFDKGQLFLYDSMNPQNEGSLGEEERDYVQRRYPDYSHALQIVRVTQQPDAISCGIYAVAFAVHLALGEDPKNVNFSLNVREMRVCCRSIIETKRLISFPRASIYHISP